RRPSSRVSATDAVSTKVFIPGALQPFHPRAVAEPNPRSRVNLAHHGQWELDALEDAPGGGDARRWCRADQLEVLGILHGERPFLPGKTLRQWETFDVDRRPQARAVDQSLYLAPQHGPRGIEPAHQGGRQRERPQRPADVAAGDRAAEAPRLLRDALVEAEHIGDRKCPAERQRHEREAWLCAHRGQVAEVDGDQPTAECCKIEPRPLQTKIRLLDHGVGGRHNEWVAAPDRGVILWRRDQQGSRRPIEVTSDRAQEAALAQVRKRPRPARDAMGYTGRPSTGLLATAFRPMWA